MMDKSPAQQNVIADTNQLLAYIKPISHQIYWKVLKKDPRAPKPVLGGDGCKAFHSLPAWDEYLNEVARTGFMAPDGTLINK